nr:hypothetical protein BaRGS_010363 [Batillaria attramentaria]
MVRPTSWDPSFTLKMTTQPGQQKYCLGIIKRVDNVTDSTREVPDFKAEFPKLFSGLGTLQTKYTITLKPDAHPVCLYAPRKIPHPLIPKVKDEIERMQAEGVISPITEPTSWCSGIVVVPKPNGAVRICVDLTHLNKSVQREVHPMASVDQSLAQLANSKIFTKLDAKSGFWQIPLSEESRKYTTFVTPFGRFCFNRLPFGISSASEVFQRTMSTVLSDLEGVICHMDDVLVHAENQAEHDAILRQVMQRLQDAGLTLNDKCEFSKPSIKFLGHIIDSAGIRPDPAKIEAIQNYPAPSNVTELQRFLGMLNQLAKFTPNIASPAKEDISFIKDINAFTRQSIDVLPASSRRLTEIKAAQKADPEITKVRDFVMNEMKEPLLPSSFPDRPWSRVGMDLLDLKGKSYIVVVDYYSRWVELRYLESQTSSHTISQIKSIFAVHGIPDVVMSDNGPQFASAEFNAFAAEYAQFKKGEL